MFRVPTNSVLRHLALGCLLMALTAQAVQATVPAPEPDPAQASQEWLDGGPRSLRVMPPSLGPFNYLREFDQIVGFLAVWQELESGPDYGGMIEAESGDLADVIQTDNTLEAIWCWSRYRELTGRDTYDERVAAAWIYCLNFPAWEEEGAAGDDYYRVHNCAWGLTAVLQYAAATGDDTYASYAATCAGYIRSHSLELGTGDIYTQRLNAFVKGWAAGNLYLYAEAMSSGSLMAAAVDQGNDVLDWLNTYPPNYLGFEYWAMSSGTAVWGVCNSVFRDDPAAGEAWLTENAGYIDLWQDWYSVPGYDWDCSWNVAYCNAHFAVWDILGDETFWQNGVAIADALLSYDTDDDGGIMADSTAPDTEDMSWVTSYVAKMGVDRLIGQPHDHDVGILRFVGLEDGQYIEPGTPIPVRILATNFGLADAPDASVHIVGDAGDATWSWDLPFAALDTVIHTEAWLPPGQGQYTLTAWTELPGDENEENDTVSITLQIGQPTAVAEPNVAGLLLRGPDRNPFDGRVNFAFRLGAATSVHLEVYDLKGRRVARLGGEYLGAGEHSYAWNGRDESDRVVAAGTYLYRLVGGGHSRSGKLIKLR